MKKKFLINRLWLMLFLSAPFLGASAEARSTAEHDLSRVQAKMLQLPLSFEANVGQWPPDVKYLSRGSAFSLLLKGREAVFVPNQIGEERQAGPALRMRFAGSSRQARIGGLDPRPATSSYFIGRDPSRWRSGIPHSGRVVYRNLYRGIDLVVYGSQQQLEYDLVVAPGANLDAVRLDFKGAEQMEIDPQGNLVLQLDSGRRLIHHKPSIYQIAGGTRKPVAGAYFFAAPHRVGFRVGEYDRSRTLLVDPIVSYSTFLGGSRLENASGIAVDAAGSIYITGATSSTNYPTLNPIQGTYRGGDTPTLGGGDIFVTKLNGAGTALVYSTYIGGTAGEFGGGIAVDSAGNAYVSGETRSGDFPLSNAIQRTLAGGQDAFLMKLNSAGSALVYSTFIGGNGAESSRSVAVDSNGAAYIGGSTASTDLPGAAGSAQSAYGGGGDGFVTKLNPAGSQIVYSSYFGGGDTEVKTPPVIAVDATGGVCIVGSTASIDLPVTRPFQPSFGGGVADGFLAKLTPDGKGWVFATYFGGSGGDFATWVALDGGGNIYLTGVTDSTNFPTLNPFQPTYAGGSISVGDLVAADGFVSKLSPAADSLIYSTYYGGTGAEFPASLAVDAAGGAYIAGITTSLDLPTVEPLQQKKGFADAFFAKVEPGGSKLAYSTYLGGNDVEISYSVTLDSSGNVYLTGVTNSSDFPTLKPFSGTFGGGQPFNFFGGEGFITKINSTVPNLGQEFTIPNRGGVSLVTRGTGPAVIGWARIRPAAGKTTPAGVAIFGVRQGGNLVSEAGVPASPLVRSARIYAEVNGPVNTGVAVANPGDTEARLNFFFTDNTGRDFGAGTFTLGPRMQVAKFLNEPPFNGGSSISGTFTFTSDIPVAVIALRGFSNERGDFLITTLPAVDLATTSTDAFAFADFADGGGWLTQIILVNPTDEVLNGTVTFMGQGSGSEGGAPINVTIEGQNNSSFSYSIPARSSRRLVTTGSASVRVGWVRVTPAANNKAPSGLVVFSFKTGGITVSEAGVPAGRSGTAFRMYAEATGTIQSGVAISNSSGTPVTVNFELTTLAGESTGLTGALTVPASGQIAVFLGEIPGFQSVQTVGRGILRISTASTAGITIVGLRGRTNERGDFLITTTPAVDENAPASAAELFYPDFADGGGFNTQFIVFSGSVNQSTSGLLEFFLQSGQPLILNF